MNKISKEKIAVFLAAVREAKASDKGMPISGKFPNITVNDGDWEFETPSVKVLSKDGEYFIETKKSTVAPYRFEWLIAALLAV
jgi:hypothetical protein